VEAAPLLTRERGMDLFPGLWGGGNAGERQVAGQGPRDEGTANWLQVPPEDAAASTSGGMLDWLVTLATPAPVPGQQNQQNHVQQHQAGTQQRANQLREDGLQGTQQVHEQSLRRKKSLPVVKPLPPPLQRQDSDGPSPSARPPRISRVSRPTLQVTIESGQNFPVIGKSGCCAIVRVSHGVAYQETDVVRSSSFPSWFQELHLPAVVLPRPAPPSTGPRREPPPRGPAGQRSCGRAAR